MFIIVLLLLQDHTIMTTNNVTIHCRCDLVPQQRRVVVLFVIIDFTMLVIIFFPL